MALSLGESLVKSNGQDISRRGKSKNVMVIMPTDFAFQRGTEGTIIYFERLDTQQPVLVIDTELVREETFLFHYFIKNIGKYSISWTFCELIRNLFIDSFTAKKKSISMSRYYLKGSNF